MVVSRLVRERWLCADRPLMCLANVGDCVLRQELLNNDTAHEDVCSVGRIMIELMEEDTSILRPKEARLARPEVWEDETGIKAFLGKTQKTSLADSRRGGTGGNPGCRTKTEKTE